MKTFIYVAQGLKLYPEWQAFDKKHRRNLFFYFINDLEWDEEYQILKLNNKL